MKLRFIPLILCLILLSGLFPLTAAVSPYKGASGWAREGVYFCAGNSIIKGVGGNKFNPRGNSSREAAIIVCTRAYELHKGMDKGTDNTTNQDKQSGSGTQDSNSAAPDNILVINDWEFKEGDYAIREKDQGTFIFVPLDKFKYAFIYPYSSDNRYPDAVEQDGDITFTWKDREEILLEVSMHVGSAEAAVNRQSVNIIAGPYRQDNKIMIPINFFVKILEMKAEEFMGRSYLQYKNDFNPDVLAGSWYYTDTDLFTAYKDMATGYESRSSFDESYTFRKDGTYNMGMITTGGFNDMCIVQSGKYKVIGNTIIYYDIVETVYEGTPFREKYKSKHKDAPEYDFINNYNAEEDKIEIDGFWLHRP